MFEDVRGTKWIAEGAKPRLAGAPPHDGLSDRPEQIEDADRHNGDGSFSLELEAGSPAAQVATGFMSAAAVSA